MYNSNANVIYLPCHVSVGGSSIWWALVSKTCILAAVLLPASVDVSQWSNESRYCVNSAKLNVPPLSQLPLVDHLLGLHISKLGPSTLRNMHLFWCLQYISFSCRKSFMHRVQCKGLNKRLFQQRGHWHGLCPTPWQRPYMSLFRVDCRPEEMLTPCRTSVSRLKLDLMGELKWFSLLSPEGPHVQVCLVEDVLYVSASIWWELCC